MDALRQVQASNGSARDKLRTLLIRHIRAILEQGLGNVFLTDLENLTSAQRLKYVAKRDEFEPAVRTLIEAGIRSKEFFCNDVKLAGFTMLGAINWTSKWYRPNGRLSSEAIATGMSDFLIRGLVRECDQLGQVHDADFSRR